MTGRILQLVALLLLALTCSSARAQDAPDAPASPAILEITAGEQCEFCIAAQPMIAKLRREGIKIVQYQTTLEGDAVTRTLGVTSFPAYQPVDALGHAVGPVMQGKAVNGPQAETMRLLRRTWRKLTAQPTTTQ